MRKLSSLTVENNFLKNRCMADDKWYIILKKSFSDQIKIIDPDKNPH